MHIELIVSVVAVAVIIWKFFVLSLAKKNTKKIVQKIINTAREEGVDAAVELCEKTSGPIAAIMYAGLRKQGKNIEEIEKSIENAASIEMAFLEKGLVILTTCSTVAPLTGFLGTVSGMIRAFDSIAAAGEVSPTLVASGISEALITTAAGLVVAIPIHIFHNLFIALIDGMIVDMEDSSLVLMEYLAETA